MKQILFNFTLSLFFSFSLHSQSGLPESYFDQRLIKDEITRAYILPEKIVWQSDQGNQYVMNPDVLLQSFKGQLSTSGKGMCVMRSDSANQASILLDYGREIYGGIEIAAAIRKDKRPVKIRVRLGESVSEAMSDCGGDTPGMGSATNDHSLRDFTVELPWLGTVEIGNSGFRFVRIDLIDQDVDLPLRAARAIFRYRDVPYLGSFRCNDERLNKIWEVGAYTVHLNMQDYLWDGIKRDRLVWVGDMHPEVMTIHSVFGSHPVVRKSLDFARESTPLPGWMNGISSYSLWWIIIHRDLYLHQGDLKYLKEQHAYLTGLIRQIVAKIDENGKEELDGGRFLDWPTSEMPEVIHAGLQSLTAIALEAGKELAEWLKDEPLEEECSGALRRLKRHQPSTSDNKQAAALLSLAGLIEPDRASAVILKNGASDFATFYGYYMLEALAKDNQYSKAMKIISDYWGAMIDLGATTFWENFNYGEHQNATPIDRLPDSSTFDIHADGGAYCYVGLRASLCHGWASGPTSWLTAHVLGIRVVEPGSTVIQIRPNLGNLNYAEGSFPTPFGIVEVKHVKQANGTIKSEITAPNEVQIVR